MILRDEIQQFLDKIDPKIMERGRDYYYDGRVERIYREESHIAAQVYGSDIEPYLVDIHFTEDGTLDDWTCDCPYDWDDVCKHIAAVLLSLVDEPEEKQPDQPNSSIQTLLEQAEKAQLAALILDHCREDQRFQSQVISELESSGGLELQAIQELVKNTIRTNKHHGYIDWNGCNNICADLDDALEKAQRRAERGQHGQALEISQFVLLTGVELAGEADSSSGSLGWTIHAALETIELSANALAESGSDRTVWVNKLLDTAQNPAFDGWADWCYDFLQRITVLADVQNEDLFYAVLDRMSDQQWERFQDSAWYVEQDKLTRYQIIGTAHGPKEAHTYLEQNLDVDPFRLTLVKEEIQAEKYARAEQLCLERIEAEQNSLRVWSSQWQELLYTIYQAWGRREKQIEQARKLALAGDMNFYHTLKKLLTTDGRWQEEAPKFLEAYKATHSPHEYMALLEREQETSLLMEQVRHHPYMVFRYGSTLSSAFGEEIYTLCSAEIRERAKMAGNRKEYRGVCSMILALAQWGGRAEAKLLINELRQTYPRRPALWDELQKLERSIAKKQ